MFSFLKSLVGAGATAASPSATGVTYLKSELRKSGANPEALPNQLYRDLAEHADRYSRNMAELLPDDQPVTYFVQHLDYIAIALSDFLAGRPLEIDDGIAEVLARYQLSFR